MARQYNKSAGIKDQPVAVTTSTSIGFLNFWTLTEGHFQEADLINSAKACSVPQWMIDRIKGRTVKSAWTDATQLGAKGKPSRLLPTEPKDSKSRYLVRDFNEESRAIIRETVLPNSEKVETDTLAVVYLEGIRMSSHITPHCPELLKDELQRVIDGMQDEMNANAGLVNTGRVRALILDWLDRQHRICVRGTGGVYMIPRPSEDILADQLIFELTAIQSWVRSAPLTSLFTIVEMFDTATTSKQDFVDSALAEIKGEVETVNEKLVKWAKNGNMNAGSMAYSSGEMVNRLEGLRLKVEALKDLLGESIGIAESMIEIVLNKAKKMEQESSTTVTASRTEKQTAKTAKDTSVVVQPTDTKKKGTAKDRASKTKL